MDNVTTVLFKERRLVRESNELVSFVENQTLDNTVEYDGDWNLCQCGNWHHYSLFCECDSRGDS